MCIILKFTSLVKNKKLYIDIKVKLHVEQLIKHHFNSHKQPKHKEFTIY
jgi:hypothetical protein